MVRNEGDKLTRVVICPPRKEYFTNRDLVAHNIARSADRALAVKQHSVLASTLHKGGCEVITIPELTGHPNSVFTRDTALITPRGYIMLRMGLQTRRGEESWMSRELEKLEEPCAGTIYEPGTVEGGDIIMAGEVAFVGHSARTNAAGIQQLKKILLGMNYCVRVAEIASPRLHIGGAMSMIAPDRLLCCKAMFPDGFFQGFDVIEVRDDTFISGNVICLSANTVIAEKENDEVIAMLEKNDVVLHVLDLSEFVKGRGGPTCLIMPLERCPE